MASAVTVKVEGLAELGRALSAFPPALAKRYLRRATYEAARAFADDAAQRAASARLYKPAMEQIAKNIAVFARRDVDPGTTAHYSVGVRRIKLSRKIKSVLRTLRRAGQGVRIENDTFFWHWFEFGTQDRHTKKGAYRGKILAQPFLRPAFEAKKDASVEVFKAALAAGVDAAAREVAK